VGERGFLEQLGPGGIHLSMSTVAPDVARRLAAIHAAHGSVYVEAPVFGRPEAAAARKLWIPVAGPPAAKDRIRPVLTALGAQGIFDFGEQVGAASTVKLAGNFLIIAAGRSLAEALTMAEKTGVDPKAVVEIYGKLIAEKTAPWGQSDIPHKDLSLFTATAQAVESPTPIAGLLLELTRNSTPHSV
jgi:3-hydroxyisobutyrate dehydrogenase-like beta-hydroxyacid dehydrogenase